LKRRQKAEGRRQKAEGRRQKMEDGREDRESHEHYDLIFSSVKIA
jgi:hypothetical protein